PHQQGRSTRPRQGAGAGGRGALTSRGRNQETFCMANQFKHSMRHLKQRAALTVGALTIALLPSLLLSVEAGAGEGSREISPRERVLTQMAKDPAALINVSYGEMPSSPDVLNLGKRGTAALARCLQDNANTDVR